MYVLAPNQVIETYPYSIGDLRRDNPNTSFPRNPSVELLADWNVFPVVDRPVPMYDASTKTITQTEPTLENGEWVTNWKVSNLSKEELTARSEQASASVRANRDELLTSCDWTQLPDSPADTEAWTVYRQKLRDLPEQAGFPYEISWPEQP